MCCAQRCIGTNRWEVFCHFIFTFFFQLIFPAQRSKRYSLAKEFAEIKIVLWKKVNWGSLKNLISKINYLEDHSGVIDAWFWKNIKAKRSALVILCFIIPVECTYAKLKSYEFLTSELQFLISLFHCVVIVTAVFESCRVPYTK